MRLMVDWLNPVLAASMPAGPVCGTLGRLFQRQSYDLLDLLIANLARGSRTRFVPQPGNAFGDEPIAPKTHRETGGTQLRRHRSVVQSTGALQNDPGTEGY